MIRQLHFDELSSTMVSAKMFFDESQLPGKFDFNYWMERWRIIYNLDMGTIFVFEVEGINRGCWEGYLWNVR